MTSDTTTGKGAAAPDPITLAIQRHAKADAAYDAAIAAGTTDDDDAPRLAEYRAYWGLVDTAPTTLAGCRELCAHLARYAQRDKQWAELRDYDPERGWTFGPRLLGNLRDALARIERE